MSENLTNQPVESQDAQQEQSQPQGAQQQPQDAPQQPQGEPQQPQGEPQQPQVAPQQPQGEPQQPQVAPQQPQSQASNAALFTLPPHKNYMVWAILATIFCCLVGGIVAIIYSSKSNGLYNSALAAQNDAMKQQLYYESDAKNRTAKTWLIVCIITAIVAYSGYIILAALGVVGSLIEL